MPQLAIALLGPPQIERDGVRVGFDTRKATALLAYLACTGRAHSRDALAALLWPEYADARNALRRTLSTIQRALGAGWIDVGRDQVAAIPQSALWLDVAIFAAQVTAAGDRAALQRISERLNPSTIALPRSRWERGPGGEVSRAQPIGDLL